MWFYEYKFHRYIRRKLRKIKLPTPLTFYFVENFVFIFYRPFLESFQSKWNSEALKGDNKVVSPGSGFWKINDF